MNKLFIKCRHYQKPGDAISKALPVFVIAEILLLVLVHGGYYPYITFIASAIALVLSVVVAIKQRGFRPSLSSIFVVLVTVCFLVSMVVNTVTLTSLLSLTAILSLAAPCVLISQMDSSRKWDAFCLLTTVGVFTAVGGILMAFGVISLEGGVDSAGLCFTFQYANAAGIWYAIIAMLCVLTMRKYWKLLAVLPLGALVLTKSMGAILVLAVVAFVLLMIYLINPKVLQVSSSCSNKTSVKNKKASIQKLPTVAIVGVACLIVVAVVAIVLIFMPLPQTFVERMIQIQDGLTLWLTHPIGIGPNMWQFAYPYMQSAQYTAAILHCSYVQLMLDGGIVALLLFVAFVSFSLFMLIRQRQVVSVVSASMLLMHAVFDMDFSFSSMWLLLFLFLDCSDIVSVWMSRKKRGSVDVVTAPKDKGSSSGGFAVSVISAALLAFSGVAVVAGMMFNFQMNATEHLVEKAYAGGSVDLLSAQPAYVKDDPKARANYSSALAMSSNKSDIINGQTPMSADEAMYKALAMARNKDMTGAYNLLLSEIEREHFNISFINEVRKFLVETNAPEDVVAKFNQLADKCNFEITQWPASALQNQEPVEKI